MKLPSVFGSDRGKYFSILVLNGIAQAGAAVSMSLLLSKGLGSKAGAAILSQNVLTYLTLLATFIILLRAFERSLAETIGQSYVTSCRMRFFEVIASSPLHGGVSGRQGILMTRLITDLTSLKNWIGFGLSKIAVSFFSVGGAIIALYLLNGNIAFAALCAIGFTLLLGLLSSFMLRVKIRNARSLRGRLSAGIGEIASAKGLSLHFNRIAKDKRRFRNLSKKMSSALIKRNFWAGLMRSLPELVLPLTFFLMFFLSMYSINASKLNPVVFATSLFMISLIMLPLSDVMIAIEYYMSYREGRYRLQNAIRRNVSIYIKGKTGQTPQKDKFCLSIDNATIAGCRKKISFTLNSGEAALIVADQADQIDSLFFRIAGLSLDILDGKEAQELSNGLMTKIWYYFGWRERPHIAEKTISINGVNILDVPSEDWHSRIKLLSPKLPLLKGSIRKNIRYGANKISDEKLTETLKLCGIDNSELEYQERGHQTRLYEDGKNITNSLRARITLARAIAAKPDLLLVNDLTFITDHKSRQALFNVIKHTSIAILMTGIDSYHFDRWSKIFYLNENGLEYQEKEKTRLATKLRTVN